MKKIIHIFALFLVCFAGNAFAALSSTFSLPANTAVTMGDSSATMPFQVANTGDVDIKVVQFTVDPTVYNIGVATTAPSGWTIISTLPAGSVCFKGAAAADKITPGGSQTFNVALTGPSAGSITNANADQTDVLATGSGSDNAANCTGVTAPTSSSSWTRKALAVDLIATPPSVSVGSTITLTMQVTNRSTVTQSGIVSGPSYTPAAVTNTGGPTPASLSLDPGVSSTMTWTYQADSTATVSFSASAGNSVPATSKTESSNPVVIGNFTALVSVDPLSVISGQTVAVTMVVANNGSSGLGNVTPTLTAGGTATATLSSGPTPTNITSLGPGQSGTFTWTFTISGTQGQTYFFSGYATAGASTNTSVSATGSITIYSVTVSPDTIPVGSTNQQIGWTVYNNGNKPIKEVDITFPAGWAYASANGGGWAVLHSNPTDTTVYFTAGTQIPTPGSKTFYITFASLPNVTSDTAYIFPVQIIDQVGNGATINTTITETAYVMDLTAYPVSIPADGTIYSTLTATLTKGGGAVSGVPVTFTTTAGTLAVAPPRTDYTTDANGVAKARLISLCSQATITPLISASYLNALDQTTVVFAGVATGTLVYVGGSLSPISVVTPTSPVFTLQLLNCGSTTLTINTANSTLIDAIGNSFTLSTAATITAGLTGTLSFNPNPVISKQSKCHPRLTVNAGTYAGPYALNKSPKGDRIETDFIVVDSGTFCPIRVRIIDWREVLR